MSRFENVPTLKILILLHCVFHHWVCCSCGFFVGLLSRFENVPTIKISILSRCVFHHWVCCSGCCVCCSGCCVCCSGGFFVGLLSRFENVPTLKISILSRCVFHHWVCCSDGKVVTTKHATCVYASIQKLGCPVVRGGMDATHHLFFKPQLCLCHRRVVVVMEKVNTTKHAKCVYASIQKLGCPVVRGGMDATHHLFLNRNFVCVIVAIATMKISS